MREVRIFMTPDEEPGFQTNEHNRKAALHLKESRFR